MYERLEGNNIVLRKASPDDYKSMLENIWSDEEVYKWMLFPPALTVEDAIDRTERTIEYQKNAYAYFVALKDSDEAIGFCGIKEKEPGRFDESGICIARKCQGNGYGKEVVSLLLDLAFNKLDAIDFQYGYFQDNHKSKKLAEEFGFTYDRTIEFIRPWDQELKLIDECLLDRETYQARP